MFDVQDVFRFYRCPITDVHIGRSLVAGFGFDHARIECSQRERRGSGLEVIAMWAADAQFLCAAVAELFVQ